MSNTQQEGKAKTPLSDLRESALRHYEEASAAIHHWSSFVENAIKAYNPEALSPLSEDELKAKFAHYIGGENYTYEELNTREQDTLEWALKELSATTISGANSIENTPPK